MKHKKKYIYISIIGIVAVFLVVCCLFQISKSRTFQFFGELTDRVDTNEKVVALTFDDAPTKYTTDVLKVLQQKKVKATFYEIGAAMENEPGIAKAIVQAGMEAGNHSYSHERFYFKSQEFIDKEIQLTNKLIRESGYKGEITFRPPNGKKLFGLPWYLAQNNIHTIMWDVEPDTYIDPNATDKEKTDFIVKNILENTKPGSIILLHPFCETCKSDRDAIPIIIDELRAKGYALVTVSELLKYERSKN